MIRDVNFYHFLKDAVTKKYKNAQALDFHGIDYDPWIYKWARDTFRQLKTPEFLNIQLRPVLERLYERIHVDPRLKPLDNPDLALGKKEYELSERFHRQFETERELAQQAAPAGQISAAEPVGAASGGGGNTTRTMPHVPTIPTQIPEVETSKLNNLKQYEAVTQPDLGGRKEIGEDLKGYKTEVKSTAQPPKFQAPKVPGSFKNTLKNFGSAGGRFFQGNVGKFLTPGRVVTGFTTILGGVIGQGVAGSPGAFGGAVLGAFAPAAIRANGGSWVRGLAHNAANVVSIGSNEISRGSLLMKGASKKVGIGILVGFLIMALGVGILAPLSSNQQTTPVATATSIGCPDTATNRGDTACRPLNPAINLFDTQISQQNIESYIQKYRDRFVGKQLNDGSTGTEEEFKRRITHIISTAQSVELNPALFLSFWRTETAFSTAGRAGGDMGCRLEKVGVAINDFYESVRCAVGTKTTGLDYEPSITSQCAVSKDVSSRACQMLKGIRSNPISDSTFEGTQPLDSTNAIQYPIATFDDYMEAYGPRRHLFQGLHTNCTNTYNTTIEVAKEVGMCKAASTIPIIAGLAVSCPVPGGKITTSSYNASQVSGHCSGGYQKNFTCAQCPNGPNTSRRADAIDIETGGPGGKDVVLPTVQGQSVTWKFLNPPICAGAGTYPNCSSSNGGTGALYNFEGTLQGSADKWYVQFVHMSIAPNHLYLQPGQSYPSGTSVGKTIETHVHTTIGKNVTNPNATCDAGWLPSDFMCDGTIQTTTLITSYTPAPGKSVVVLDPGHAVPDYIEHKDAEATLNLIIADRLKATLEALGFTVFLTQDKQSFIPGNSRENPNKYLELLERVRKINSTNANILVSIHFDSGDYSFAGPRAYYNRNRSFSQQNLKLAEAIGSELSDKTGLFSGSNIGLDTTIAGCSGPLYILGSKGAETCPGKPESTIQEESAMPGVLVEMFKRKDYAQIAKDEKLVNDIVNGYAAGIVKYFQQ